MDTKIQLQLAKEAGIRQSTGDSWLEEYKYHLGMVHNPFPFGLFKAKALRLDGLFASDPEAKNRSIDRTITNLCNELGY